MKTKFDFTDFLESKRAISSCLLIGVLFLVNTYQKIMFMIDPDNVDLFVYPYFLRVLLSHVDSLFFGFATIIIMFQSNKKSTKVLYCCFEGLMIFLNFNRNFITEFAGINSTFYIVTYISIFAGFTLFILGTLAKGHRTIQAKEKAIAQDKQDAKEMREEKQKYKQTKTNTNADIGFNFGNLPKNEQEDEKNTGGRPPISKEQKKMILEDLKNGLSIRKTAQKNKVAFRSVQYIKKENIQSGL